MVWVIVEFSDLTVACVPKKWLTKKGKIKKCYYPKSGALHKIKNAVDVDTKSGEWKLYSYRLLMKGEEFETYFMARKAEVVAQNHSTMSNFQRSFAAKQESRKHPKVHFDTSSVSSSSSVCQDFKNIKQLAKIDAARTEDSEKVYTYNGPANENEIFESVDAGRFMIEQSRSRSSDFYNDQPVENDEEVSSDDEEEGDDSNNSSESDGDSSSDDGGNVSECDGKNSSYVHSDNHPLDVNADASNNGKGEEDDSNVSSESDDDSPIDGDVNNVSDTEGDDKITSHVHRDYHSTLPFESTNKEHDAGYSDFSAERRLPYIEKGVFSACQQLEEQKAVLTKIEKSSAETKQMLQGLIPIIKELTAEVFDSKEEIKKRNGLFTDLLAPNVQLTIKDIQQYDDVEKVLRKHKVVDNVIKYLASTVNEKTEKDFLKACLGVVFHEKFLIKKVMWMKMPKKVCIKHSQILHCIRESFKLKFGLGEPKKSDKDINGMIYKICRNMKDKDAKKRKARKAEKAKVARIAEKAGAAEKTKKKERKLQNIEYAEKAKRIETTNKKDTKLERDERTAEKVQPNDHNNIFGNEEANPVEEHTNKKAIRAAKKATKLQQVIEVEQNVNNEKIAKADHESEVNRKAKVARIAEKAGAAEKSKKKERKLQNIEYAEKAKRIETTNKKDTKLERDERTAEKVQPNDHNNIFGNEQANPVEEHTNKKARRAAKKAAKLQQVIEVEQNVNNERIAKADHESEVNRKAKKAAKKAAKLEQAKQVDLVERDDTNEKRGKKDSEADAILKEKGDLKIKKASKKAVKLKDTKPTEEVELNKANKKRGAGRDVEDERCKKAKKAEKVE